KIAEMKRLLRPHADPAEWHLHTYEIRGSEARKRLGITASIREIDAALAEIARTLADPKLSVWLSATVFPVVDKKAHRTSPNEVRDHTLTASLVALTDLSTRQGITPSFVLEAQLLSH